MSTALSIREDRGIDEAVWSALTSSIFPGAEERSVALAFDYCKARNLDVMKKPCHIVPMNVKDAKTGKYGWRDVIMPGIAEARITAFRTGEFAGLSEPTFGPISEMDFGGKKHHVPEWCQITAYRFLNGEKAAFPHREYFEEARAVKKDGDLNSMWSTRKRGQLSKCAEAGALRKAFPEELGGITTADETLTDIRDVTPPSTRAKSKVEALPKFSGIGESASERGPQQTSEPADEIAADAGDNGNPPAPDSPPPKERPAGKLIKATLMETRTSKGKKKNGAPFTRYGFRLSLGDGEFWAGTFRKSLGSQWFDDGEDVLIIVEKDGEHYELLWIESANVESGEEVA